MNIMAINDTLDKITAKLNRLKSEKAALENRSKQQTKKERMSRTRTLIQMGGLLSLVNIPAYFDIEAGDDLQTDLEKRDQSMMLLGLLVTVAEQMPASYSEDRKREFMYKGLRFMKEHQRV
jgi:short subunit fatty acids transporter